MNEVLMKSCLLLIMLCAIVLSASSAFGQNPNGTDLGSLPGYIVFDGYIEHSGTGTPTYSSPPHQTIEGTLLSWTGNYDSPAISMSMACTAEGNSITIHIQGKSGAQQTGDADSASSRCQLTVYAPPGSNYVDASADVSGQMTFDLPDKTTGRVLVGNVDPNRTETHSGPYRNTLPIQYHNELKSPLPAYGKQVDVQGKLLLPGQGVLLNAKQRPAKSIEAFSFSLNAPRIDVWNHGKEPASVQLDMTIKISFSFNGSSAKQNIPDPITIFISGVGENTLDKYPPVHPYWAIFKQKHPNTPRVYAYTEGDEVKALIDGLPLNQPINLVGHSAGGETAAIVAKECDRKINLLITVDPDGANSDPRDIGHPSRRVTRLIDGLMAHVNQWVDIRASTGWVRGADPWDYTPKGICSDFIDAVGKDHANFSSLMDFKQDGSSASQILNLAATPK